MEQYGGSIERVTTTATAAGTTTLVNTSTQIQVFTGTTTQTVILPVATTYTTSGGKFEIYNESTGAITLENQDTTTLATIPGGTTLVVKLSNNTTANGTWVSLASNNTSSLPANSVGNTQLAPGLKLQTSSLTPSGGSVTMNVGTANSFYVSVASPSTLTVNMSGFIDGQTAMIAVNANSNAVTVVFSPTVRWQGGSQPAQTTGTDIYTILYNAVTGFYYGNAAQDY